MKRPILIVGAFVLAYILAVVLAGRFTQPDEVAFKAAGREWARSGRFAAPELTGFRGLDPPVAEVWLAHLPLYTYLFGLFVKVFGFGPTESVLFDAMIHAALVLITYYFAREDVSARAAAVAALLVIPLGTTGRPDELAICLGMLSVLAIRRRRTVLSGVLLGLCAATSSVAALVFAIVWLAHAIGESGALRTVVVAFITASATFLLALLPILWNHPEAYRQFLVHAGGQPRGFQWYAFSWRYGKAYLLLFAGALVVSAYAFVRVPRRQWVRLYGAPGAALLLLFAALPSKYLYLWFLGPWMVVAAVILARSDWGHRAFWAAIVVAGFIPATVPFFKSLVIMSTLPAEQRLGPNLTRLRRIIPAGAGVLTSEFWAALAGDYRVFSADHASPPSSAVDFVILTANGSGQPGRPQNLRRELQQMVSRDFEPVHNNLGRHTVQLLGIPLTRSSWGYGTVVLCNQRSGACR